MEKPDIDYGEVTMMHPTGSAFTCSPPVEDTDWDWAVLPKDFDKFAVRLVQSGWVMGGSEIVAMSQDDQCTFASFRKDKHNIMLVKHRTYYERIVTATKLAKKFNLLKKEDRVALFEAVADGQNPDVFLFKDWSVV